MKRPYLIIANLVIALLVFFSGCALLSPTKPFSFFQMADTQFGFFNADKEFSRETKNFEEAIAAANRIKPAFVVVCGDLVNKPGDLAQIREYKRIASKLDPSIRLYNVSGNHDVENVPSPGSITKYREHFGADHYTFRSGKLFGIVLNSSLMKEPGTAPEEAAAQDLWLRSALEQAKRSNSKSIMVFMHHSLFLSDPDEPDQYFNLARERRKMYLDLFEKYKVKHVFAGHYHRNAWGRSGNLEMITTGPVGRPLGSDSSGFRIVTVKGSLVNHKYYRLDSLPQQLDLNGLKR